LLARKLGLVVAFVVWTFVLGILLASPLLVLATIPVVLYLALAMLSTRPHLQIKVSRRLPERQIYEGEEVSVAIRVTNEGPHVDLEILDLVPPGVRPSSGSNHVFLELGEGETVEFGYSFPAELFGTYAFGPTKARALDRTTVWSEEKTFEVFSQLRVYPEVRYLSRLDLKHTRPRNWPGEVPTRRAGSGLEFYGIRGYVPGDSLRRVNWKASGRLGRLMINQYMNEAGGETVVVLDSRPSSAVGVFPETTTAYSVRAAAAVSYRLLRDRNRVGILGLGRQIVNVQPGFGTRQFRRILAGLVSVGIGDDDWSLDLVPYYISLYYSRMVQIVLVSPLLDFMPFRMVSELGRKGYDTLVISPSPIELDVPKVRDERLLRVATELAKLDRNRKLASLRRHTRVVDWNTRIPLGEALEVLREPWQVRRPA
jgi:uncharacterized protein (DUF58 family)